MALTMNSFNTVPPGFMPLQSQPLPFQQHYIQQQQQTIQRNGLPPLGQSSTTPPPAISHIQSNMAVANAYAMQMASMPPPHNTSMPSTPYPPTMPSFTCPSAPGFNNVVQWITERPSQISSNLLSPFPHQPYIHNIAPSRPFSPTFRQYKMQPLQKRLRYDIVVCFLRDPEDFYIRVMNCQEELICFMTSLNSFYNDIRNQRPLRQFIPGMLCAARYQDYWYRGQIKEHTKDSIVVRYVDYGTDQTMDTHEVFDLNDEFVSKPMFAIQSCLHALQPRVMWTHEEINAFEELVMNRELIGMLISNDGVYQWEIFNKHTRSSIGVDFLDRIQKMQQPPPVVSSGTSISKVPFVTAKQGKSVTASLTTGIPERKCASLTKISESLPPQKSFVSLAGMPELDIPGEQGSLLDCEVASIESTDKFYCRLLDKKEMIDSMNKKLNDKFSNETEPTKLFGAIGGNVCAGKSLKDSKWYRCLILGRQTATAHEVFFIDCGFRERLSIMDLRAIDQDLKNVPPQAFMCRLTGVVPDATKNEKFHGCADNATVIIKLDGIREASFEVTMFDENPATNSHCNLNDFLCGRATACVPFKMAPSVQQTRQRR